MPPVVHVGAAVVALVLGAVVFAMRKGTIRHRAVGACYVGTLLLSNAVALTVTRSTGGFGPFHVLAIVSLCTLVVGLVPLWILPRGPRAIAVHGITMGFSYVGLVAAGLSQAVAQLVPAHSGVGVIATSALAFTVGAALIFSITPRSLGRTEAMIRRRESHREVRP